MLVSSRLNNRQYNNILLPWSLFKDNFVLDSDLLTITIHRYISHMTSNTVLTVPYTLQLVQNNDPTKIAACNSTLLMAIKLH